MSIGNFNNFQTKTLYILYSIFFPKSLDKYTPLCYNSITEREVIAMITEKDFTVEEKATIQKVVEYLTNNCGMFEGKFAPTADNQFVTGIETVMLTLAFMAGDEYGQKFDDKFSTNWYKSKWGGLKK